jgi:hypothetical protein
MFTEIKLPRQVQVSHGLAVATWEVIEGQQEIPGSLNLWFMLDSKQLHAQNCILYNGNACTVHLVD